MGHGLDIYKALTRVKLKARVRTDAPDLHWKEVDKRFAAIARAEFQALPGPHRLLLEVSPKVPRVRVQGKYESDMLALDIHLRGTELEHLLAEDPVGTAEHPVDAASISGSDGEAG